jgi:acyl dehydratase
MAALALALEKAGDSMLRRAFATNVEGNERKLIETIFHESVDLVRLESLAPATFVRLQRSGITGVTGATLQKWLVPPSAVPSDDGWSDRSGDWLCATSEVVAAQTGWADAWPLPAGMFWSFEGTTVAYRPDAADQAIQITGRLLCGELATRCLPRLLALCEGTRALLVPMEQVFLIQALASAGGVPGACIHRNVLLLGLAFSRMPVMERGYRITVSDIERFGAESGDMNPLHFDDLFARKLGFERRVAHGMLFNGWITRILGNEYPGPGTIFLQNETTFLGPVYPDRLYRSRWSMPWSDAERGTSRVLVQLRDEVGRMIVLSRNDVLQRDVA